MAIARNVKWDADTTTYSPEQVESVLNEIGVDIMAETEHDFLCLCPIHGNTDTPSFTVSKTHGAFFCFNPSCMESGTLVELIKATIKRNDFEAARLIIRSGKVSELSFKDRLEKALNPPEIFKRFNQDILDKAYDHFWLDERAQTYMHSRGFEDETLEYFRVGYSVLKDMIIVPMHDPKGVPVGLIGRSVEGKRFKNSKKLPRNKTAWNFHRAKRAGADTVIIVESSFDAMRIHQAGYPNVVAILGGYLSPWHVEQLDKQFNKIVIMTDFDSKQFHKDCRICMKKGSNLCLGHNPGRDLGHTIAKSLKTKRILWASYEYGVVYPHGAKDAGNMTDDEIRQCIKNSVSNIEYRRWGLDK